MYRIHIVAIGFSLVISKLFLLYLGFSALLKMEGVTLFLVFLFALVQC